MHTTKYLLCTTHLHLIENIYARTILMSEQHVISGLILGLRPANERRRYKVTSSLIGWAKT